MRWIKVTPTQWHLDDGSGSGKAARAVLYRPARIGELETDPLGNVYAASGDGHGETVHPTLAEAKGAAEASLLPS